jgi:hypothetical protein
VNFVRFIKVRWLGLLLILLAGLSLAGCATQEPENASARPWNAPKSWEGGMPMGINEGR